MGNIRKAKCWNCGTEVPKIKYDEIKYIPKCPKCGCNYPEKPKLEAKLTEYQDEYLKNRTQANLNKLFSPMRELVFNLMCSKLKKMGQCRPYEDVEDMVSWTLCKLVSYYTTKEEFKIAGSFTGYISEVIKYPLYNEKDKEKSTNEISMFEPLGEDSDETILDKLSNDSYEFDVLKVLDESESNILVKHIMDYLETSLITMYDVTNDKCKFSKTLNFMILINHFINKKTNRFFSEWWKMSDVELRDNFTKCTDLLKEILYRSIVGNY